MGSFIRRKNIRDSVIPDDINSILIVRVVLWCAYRHKFEDIGGDRIFHVYFLFCSLLAPKEVHHNVSTAPKPGYFKNAGQLPSSQFSVEQHIRSNVSTLK